MKSFTIYFKYYWEGEKKKDILTREVIRQKGLKVEQSKTWQRKAAAAGSLKELFWFLSWYHFTCGLIACNQQLLFFLSIVIKLIHIQEFKPQSKKTAPSVYWCATT